MLIVEDDPTIAEPLAYALRREGFEVDTVALDQLALARLHDPVPTFDLSVLDVGLPDMSGFEVCTAVRRESGLPILFLTARGDEIDRIVGLEIGADDDVVKPFSPCEVLARVKAILRRRLPATPALDAPSASGLHIDREQASVRYAGRPRAARWTAPSTRTSRRCARNSAPLRRTPSPCARSVAPATALRPLRER